MYIPLEKNLTKKYFRELLARAIELTEKEIEATPSLLIYKSILNQLYDINKRVVEEGRAFSNEEAHQRYTIGTIAIRYFDGYEGFEYADILTDIPYGISKYPNISES